MIPIERQELTIRKSPLYFIAAVFIVFVFILVDSGKFDDNISWVPLAGLMIFLIIYYMLSKNILVIDNDGISQQLFFGKQKEILWSDIKSSNLNWEFHGHGANLGWIITSYSGKSIHLHPSFYSRKQICLIAAALVEKTKTASLDKRIINMATGKFPWYVF